MSTPSTYRTGQKISSDKASTPPASPAASDQASSPPIAPPPHKQAPCTPCHDNILITIEKPAERTPGGIVLPPRAQDHPDRGIVVAIGAGKFTINGERLPIVLCIGETVIFNRHAGREVKADGYEDGTLLLVPFNEVLAVVNTTGDGTSNPSLAT